MAIWMRMNISGISPPLSSVTCLSVSHFHSHSQTQIQTQYQYSRNPNARSLSLSLSLSLNLNSESPLFSSPLPAMLRWPPARSPIDHHSSSQQCNIDTLIQITTVHLFILAAAAAAFVGSLCLCLCLWVFI